MIPIDIQREFLRAKQRSIASFVNEQIIDGNEPDKLGRRRIFLATNGSWQEKYLSFYEVLHDKYVARFLAQALLDTYTFPIKERILQIKASTESEQNKAEAINKLWNEARFNKIITVTVSSQLIGVALRELIRESDEYSVFRNSKETNRLKASPSLIILSSYYSFDSEKPFQKIEKDNNVIIVNDVISTGNLVYDLINKITEVRHANVKGVFSIADTRIDKHNTLNAELEAPCKFDKKMEDAKFFSLMKYDDGLEIRKYKRPHPIDRDVKRINPLLNSIVELKSSHSEEKRILFPEPSKIIGDPIFKDKEQFFKVGHFQQNLTHNSYLTDMQNIFACEKVGDPGEKLLLKLNEAIKKGRRENDPINIALSNINHNLEGIRKWSFGVENNLEIDEVEAIVHRLKFKLSTEDTVLPLTPDFIFYPIFSGIEQLNHSVLSRVFGTHIDNIIGLQRFDTSKGWRFPFPAKRFNQLTKNRSILILDSGSLTGESLVQLIDMIAFLDVKEITVLSVIARIEDFYREFYSRLKSIKVKVLQQSAQLAEKDNQPEHIVPLNTLFGTNLHISVYPSSASCPLCLELQEIRKYVGLSKRFTPSEWTKDYITSRKDEIKITNLGLLDELTFPLYLPTKRGDGRIDAIELFLMRDRIGKIESYRFYPEYFKDFDRISIEVNQSEFYNNGATRQLELILAVILHEPRLYDIIRDLLVDIKDNCEKIIADAVLCGEEGSMVPLNALYYDWSKYSLLRLAVVLFRDRFAKRGTWEEVFRFALGDRVALNYLSFLLWEGYIGESKLLGSTDFLDLVSYFSDAIDGVDSQPNHLYKNSDFRKIIKGIVYQFERTRVQSINSAYFNLRKFFFSQNSSTSHSELTRNIFLFRSMLQNEEILDPDIEFMLGLVSDMKRVLQDDVLENLVYIKQYKEFIKCGEFQYKNLFSKDGCFSRLTSLIVESDRVLEFQSEILQKRDVTTLRNMFKILDDFYVEFLLPGKHFYLYCNSYKAKLLRCLLNSILNERILVKAAELDKHVVICGSTIHPSKELNQERLAEIIKDRNADHDLDSMYVNFNEYFLMHAFEEIFLNAVKFSKPSIDIDIQVTQLDSEVKLKIIQTSPYIESQAPSGTVNIVEPLLSAFCGKSNVHYQKQANEPYTIDITFNKEELNLYDDTK